MKAPPSAHRSPWRPLGPKLKTSIRSRAYWGRDFSSAWKPPMDFLKHQGAQLLKCYSPSHPYSMHNKLLLMIYKTFLDDIFINYLLSIYKALLESGTKEENVPLGECDNQPGWDEATEVTVSPRLIHIPTNPWQAGGSAGVQLGGGSPPSQLRIVAFCWQKSRERTWQNSDLPTRQRQAAYEADESEQDWHCWLYCCFSFRSHTLKVILYAENVK